MSFVAAAVVIAAGATLYSSNKARQAQEDAQKQAKLDAQEAERQARKSEAFAQTEGEGMGQLGQISLEVDDDLDEEENVNSNVSI